MHLVPSDDPILLGKAERITFPRPDLNRIVSEMVRIMVTHNGCGLAAPQVGLPLRIVIYRYDGRFGTLINPEILYCNPELIEADEGCLSFPDEMFRTKRAKDIVISYQEITGKVVQNLKIVGFPAVILQHECDHLEGTVLPHHGEKIENCQV